MLVSGAARAELQSAGLVVMVVNEVSLGFVRKSFENWFELFV